MSGAEQRKQNVRGSMRKQHDYGKGSTTPLLRGAYRQCTALDVSSRESLHTCHMSHALPFAEQVKPTWCRFPKFIKPTPSDYRCGPSHVIRRDIGTGMYWKTAWFTERKRSPPKGSGCSHTQRLFRKCKPVPHTSHTPRFDVISTR